MDVNKLSSCNDRQELAELLDLDTKTLTFLAYGNGKTYKKFEIPKKSGGQREILAPQGTLLTVQKRLAKILNEIYKSPASVHGFTYDKTIVTNATRHLKKRTILNVDLENFFPSISDRRIIGLLRAEPFHLNNEVISTIVGIVCHKGSLPQGAPTSPVLSNMICLRLDNQLTRFCRELRVTYTRYADDITISTNAANLPPEIATKNPDGNVALGEHFRGIVASNYFSFNDKKTRISSDNQSKVVTGIKVNERLNVSRRYVSELRAMIHAAQEHGVSGAQGYFNQRYGGGGRNYLKVLRGKLEHLKVVKGYYDLTFRKLHNEFIKIDGVNGVELPMSPDQEIIDKILVVKGQGSGTGFILDDEWLITCDHVIGNNSNPQYFTYTNFPAATRKIATINPKWRSPPEGFDLIALMPSMSDLRSGVLSFKSASNDSLREGGSYRVLGFPSYIEGSTPHINPVTVSGIRNIDGVMIAYVNSSLISGYSGSPVLDSSNKVVGIVQTGSPNRRAGDEDYRHTFLPISEIKKCLDTFHG